MGLPFEGMNTIAYNTLDKEWDMSWMDTFGTGLMTGTGNREGNTLTFTANFTKMFGEGDDVFKLVTEVVDKDHHHMTMSMMAEGGEEVKWLRVDYTRVK